MNTLFDLPNDPVRPAMTGGEVIYFPKPDLGIDPDELFERLCVETNWQQRSIDIGGRQIPQPRLVAWHGTAPYTYSGLTLQPEPWTPTLDIIRAKIEAISETGFNTVLLNKYPSNRSSIGWHADDEKELGHRPVIASLSLGETRVFNMKRKDKTASVNLTLEHGSLLIMRGDTQKNWLHSVAKISTPCQPRINATFRYTHQR